MIGTDGHPRPLTSGSVFDRDVILTLGTFDGVHLGHRHLVAQVIRRARELGCLAGALTFHPHPRSVVTGESPAALTTLGERLALLKGLGLDVVGALPFTPDLARLPAFDFMGLLCEHLRLSELWVGWNFCLGHRREGTPSRLAEIGRELGYTVHTVPAYNHGGRIVCSTLIRQFVSEGQVEIAARCLGRPYHVTGVAMQADRAAGDPRSHTAPVITPVGIALPADGTYDVRVRRPDRQWATHAAVVRENRSPARRLRIAVPAQMEGLSRTPVCVEFIRCMRSRVSGERQTPRREDLPAFSGVASPA